MQILEMIDEYRGSYLLEEENKYVTPIEENLVLSIGGNSCEGHAIHYQDKILQSPNIENTPHTSSALLDLLTRY